MQMRIKDNQDMYEKANSFAVLNNKIIKKKKKKQHKKLLNFFNWVPGKT